MVDDLHQRSKVIWLALQYLPSRIERRAMIVQLLVGDQIDLEAGVTKCALRIATLPFVENLETFRWSCIELYNFGIKIKLCSILPMLLSLSISC